MNITSAIKTLVFSATFLFFLEASGLAVRAQVVDDNSNALYGGFGAPLKYVVTQFAWKGDFHRLPHHKGLKKKLDRRVFEIAQELLQPDYGLKVHQHYYPVSERDVASIMVLGIHLTVRNVKFGRISIGIKK